MSGQLLSVFASGVFIAGAAAYMGSLMLSRRMALAADPLSHLTLPGIALAMLHGFDVSLGAFPFVVMGILLIWALELRTKLPMDALTAIVFSSSVAIAFLFLPIEEAEAALVGDVSRTGPGDTIVAVVASSLIVLAVWRWYPKLVLVNVSEDLAVAEGISVRRSNLVYLFLVGVIVSLGVKIVGGLLTAALIAIPAAVAKNLAKNMRQYALGSLAVGVLSSAIGVVLYQVTRLPAGPLIILVNTVLFLASLVVAAKR